MGSSFEIDGNLVQNGANLPKPTLDWQNGPSGTLLGYFNDPDEPTGQTDNSFGQGSKENTAVPTVVTGSIPNNKSDLTNFLIADDVIDGNVFVYLGWIRANTLGTANIDFELNQSSIISGNGVTPVRTNGDILITYDFSQGGSKVELGLREWDFVKSNSGNLTTTLAWVNPKDNTDTALDLDASGFAVGAFNADPVINPLGLPNPLPSKTFGEAAVNLTAAFNNFGGACEAFSSAYVKSRSSNSFTAELKDFIAPQKVDIGTCQTVDLPNTAYASASNFNLGTAISDSGLYSVTNDPTKLLTANSLFAAPSLMI